MSGGRHIGRRAGALAAAVLGVSAHAPERPEIAIVKSESLAPYARLVAGFTAESRAETVEYDLRGNEGRAEKAFDALKARPPALVLAIGPLAANAARRSLSEVPVLFSMVPNYEKYGLEAKNVTGIALTPPARVQLQTLKAIATRVKRVGVVFDPRYSQTVLDAAAAAAEAGGLAMVSAKSEGADEVGRALTSLAGKVDALWMIADKSVATAAATKRIVDFGLQHKVPVAALSESQVKEGALFSLSPNATAIGQQAGRLANRIVFEKIDPGAIAVQVPEALDMAVNLTTLRRLGDACALAVDVLRFASKSGYAISVYE